MATLQELESALVKADQAGNADDARALAGEIRRMRSVPSQPSTAPSVSGTALDNERRVAQGGRPFDEQDRIARSQANDYQSKVDALNRQEGLGRAMGIGGRAMWRGAAAIPDIVATPVAAGLNWLGDKRESVEDLAAGRDARYFPRQGNFTESADFLMDKLGAPRPQTASERIGSEATSGIVGAAIPIGLGNTLATSTSSLLSGVGQTMRANPLLQLVGGATGAASGQVAQEAGASPLLQMLAGLGGGLAPAATSSLAALAGRGAMRGPSGAQMQQSLDDFRGVGATPSVGQAAGNARMQGLENLLSQGPTSVGPMTKFSTRQAREIGEGLQAKAEGLYRNPSSERAGRAIERGVDDFAATTQGKRSKLYDDVDALIPADKAIPLSETRKALAQLTYVPKGAPRTGASLINPEIKSLAEDIIADLDASKKSGPFGALMDGDGKIDYQSVRDIRSKIGKHLENFTITSDKPTAQYKQLYAALSRDLEQAARTEGPAATRAMERANLYYKVSQERLETIQRVVDRNGGAEKVFNAAMNGTRDGGSTMRAVMQSLPPEGQKAVTAAVIKRMGLARAGQQAADGDTFSAQTFLTNWNNLSAEARKAMFDRHGPQFTKDMDKIAKVAQNIRDGSDVFRNPSGTANRNAAIAYWSSLIGTALTGRPLAATGIATAGAGAWGTAKAFTNPDFVRWLAKSTELPTEALPGQLVVLQRRIEKSGDAETAEVVGRMRDQVSHDLYGNDDGDGLEIEIKNSRTGPAPTQEEMRRLRVGLGG